MCEILGGLELRPMIQGRNNYFIYEIRDIADIMAGGSKLTGW